MPILLDDLIAQLPSDTAERVRKAKDQFNTRVREALRQETRLSLRRRDDPDEGTERIINVPIAVVPGRPEGLQQADRQSIEDKYRLPILLAPYRQVLTALRDNGAAAVEHLIPALRAEPMAQALLDGRESHIEPTRAYADFLLTKLTEFNLTHFILQINEDVLGVYTYRVHDRFDDPNPRINLYWGIIGLIARDKGISVEGLTCAVLAHELSHAYTHVGSDANGKFWGSNDFAMSEHELKEGLAQFYTSQTCKRFVDTAPEVPIAFGTLLFEQPDAYLTHERWVKSSPEEVRLAMLETRTSGKPGTLSQFEARLGGARTWFHR